MMEAAYYEQFCVKRFTHWSVYVHEQQYHLGRIYIWAHRDGFVDIFEATLPELWELVNIVWKAKAALSELFSPDLFNYAALGNEAAHCHLHLIPRFRSPRSYQGIAFKDEQWGKNYAPYPKEPKLNVIQLHRLRDDLQRIL